MLYKPYGQTGKDVSAVAFGGMRFEDPADRDACCELVRYAHSRGVNYFDTAPCYCDDLSEAIMGEALSALPRESYYISSKSAKPDGDEFRAQLETSLERLKVDAIDFHHIWCVYSLDDFQTRIDSGAVEAAFKAKEEGLVNHVAISGHMNGDDFSQVLARYPFEGVTLGYSAINFPYRRAAVDFAGDKQMGVVTMNPLAGGLIPQNAERFDFLRRGESISVVEAALRFNVSHPAISAALVGFSNKAHVDEAVSAVTDFAPYGHDAQVDLEQHILDSFDALCTGCRYCLPCPVGLNVPGLMDAWNMNTLATGDDIEKTILQRLWYHWDLKPDAATECIQCGACEERCTQHLPILERLGELAKLAGKPIPPL